jgi:SAM-dependent methyltransferase
MRQFIINTVKREAFRPGVLGVILNPFYIIRKGLYNAVRETAPSITGRVLDFGCGSKPYEDEFTNTTAYIGVDIEVSGHKHHDSKVDFYYDGWHLPFEDSHFDAVVAFEVFEHIFDLPRVLIEIRRVLKPNGQLFFTIPFIWDEHEVPYDFGRYTSFGITDVLEKSGFVSINIKKTTSYYEAFSQLRIAYFFQHVLPRNAIFKRLLQLIIIPPMTISAILMNKIMPKSYECYCNMAVLCMKE